MGSRRLIRQSVVAFILIAMGLSWLVSLPLWFGDGLLSSRLPLIAIIMMLTPSAAALIVVFFVEKPEKKLVALGLLPVRPVGRLLGYLALALVLPIVFALIALPIGDWLGVFPADFSNFSGLQQQTRLQLAASGIHDLPVPLGVLVVAQFVNVVIAALFLNLLPALGEEIGWRGWMLPKLMRFGPWAAIGMSGMIWGLWHAPLILLGYNYPGTPGWLAVLAMTGMCTIMGGLFGWLRLRGGSVWPAALAHSSFNAAATLFIVFISDNSSVNPLHGTLIGWTGWIIPGILLFTIVLVGRFSSAEKKPIFALSTKEDS